MGVNSLKKHSEVSNYVIRRMVLLFIKVGTQKKGLGMGGRAS